MMNKILQAAVLFPALSILTSVSANANLIVNGGFEATTGSPIGGGSGWNYYESSDVPGWDGDNIELWIGRNPDAYEGEYHAELNAHGKNDGPWTISQTFATTAGQSYDLFFAYSARRGDDQSSNEAFKVAVDGLEESIDDHVKNSWNTFSKSFIADGDFATLSFTSVTPYSRTLGNFLDDVRVTVPEPGSLALLTLGLVGLSMSRKRVKTS